MKKTHFSAFQKLSPSRQRRQGAVIVIVLGLLVVLALIGVAFQYLVMNEYRAAVNWQTRYRARSLAEDGFAVAMARLRIAPTQQHWEGEGEWAYMSRRNQEKGLSNYARLSPRGDGRTLLEPSSYQDVDKTERDFWAVYHKNVNLGRGDADNRVSYGKSSLRGTSDKPNEADKNWIDLNGDGTKSADEQTLGSDLVNQTGDPLRGVSYFRADGIDLSMRKPAIESGTFRQLGDRARLKVIDTNSQLNINDYHNAQLFYMLQVLGAEVANLLLNATDIPVSAATNLFTKEVTEQIVTHKDLKVSRRIEDKKELRFIMKQELGDRFDERIFDFTMDFICINSWPLLGGSEGQILRYDIARNPSVERPMNTSPRFEEWLEDHRKPDPKNSAERAGDYGLHLGEYVGGNSRSEDSVDGYPGILPKASRVGRSPFNANTVTLPVLTALIAGIEADARFILLPKKGATGDEIFHRDTFTNFQASSHIPTDLGRQPWLDDGDLLESQHRHLVFNVSEDQTAIKNLAPYQEIVIGPMGYQAPGGTATIAPLWKSAAGADDTGASALLNPINDNGNEARNLARVIIAERDANGPFLSWMDFDYRVCHQILADFVSATSTDGADGSGVGPSSFPDLVNLGRGASWEADQVARTSLGANPDFLPKLESLIGQHPASRVKDSSDRYSYSQGGFQAWYLRSAIDMLRANFNPNGYYNKMNPESAMYTTVDVTDLRYQTAPICFSSMGIYEVTSQGEVAALRPDARENTLRDHAVAQRTYRGIVETYRTLEHTTQKDFLRTYTDENGESSVVHGLKGTMTYPNSIDTSIFTYSTLIDEKNYVRRTLPHMNNATADGSVNRRFNLDGYYSTSAADPLRGYITLHPQDRTPVTFMTLREGGQEKGRLNFYATFNTSLEARPRETADLPTYPAGAQPAAKGTGTKDGGSAAQGDTSVFRGAANTGRGNIHQYGHLPLSRSGSKYIMGMWHTTPDEAERDDRIRALWSFTSTATPDPVAQDFVDDDQWGGFEVAAKRDGVFAATYSNLRPDGVLMRGWDLSPAFWPSDESKLEGSYVKRFGPPGAITTGGHEFARGSWAVSRLAILRYRCGAVSDTTPFAPIAGAEPLNQQVLYSAPSSPTDVDGVKNIAQRAWGAENTWGGAAPSMGVDEHNKLYQDNRQFDTNFPYYQGWLDFWIKWELPPQGGSQDPNLAGFMISGGDIDPGSANFSGLIGATQFGRFSENVTDNSGDGVDYLRLKDDPNELDFEGSSFFLFKESGGYLRVSQSYFTWAYFSDVPDSIGSDKTTLLEHASTKYEPIQIGNNYRTIGKPINPSDSSSIDIEGPYIYTNDISGDGTDLGFSWARLESRADLSILAVDPTDPLILVPHNWYRFTMNYRSNAISGVAHTIYINGRKILMQGLNKGNWVGVGGAVSGTGKNTGESIVGGVPATFSLDAFEVDYLIQRSTSKSVEIDPEDRLTIGCIVRRQYGPAMNAALNSGDNTKAPVFYLDRNLVAVANATLDDVRISAEVPGALPDQLYSESEFAPNSRFQKVEAPRDTPFSSPDGTAGLKGEGFEELGRYENGFVAVQPAVEYDEGGKTLIFEPPYQLPVQIGSITWTEYRPWWDSYRNRRVDLSSETWAKAPHVTLSVKTYKSIGDAVGDRGKFDASKTFPAMDQVLRSSEDFWLAGGYALANQGKQQPVYLDNASPLSSDSAFEKAFLKYQVHFLVHKDSAQASGPWGVLNSSPVLDDVRITLMTPARVLSFEEIE